MNRFSLCLCLTLCLPIAAVGCSDSSMLKMGEFSIKSASNEPGETQPPIIVTQCSAENCNATCCGNVCRDTTENHQHCGACDNACGPEEICIDSACRYQTDPTCPPGQKMCDGTCTELYRDSNNCGSCGNSCEEGQMCISGSCQVDCGTQLRCDGTCYDPLTDRNHCGNCNTQCSDVEICISAVCTTECPEENQVLCDLECVDIMSDPNRCGSCAGICAMNQRCENGKCTDQCEEEGQTICAHTCTDTQSDPDHCGSCDTPCELTERCQAGTCTTECDNAEEMICNHICINRMTNNDNCGNCDNACASDKYCSEGSCIDTCPEEGLLICDHVCTDIQTDKNNCGKCGHLCKEKEICANGLCACPEDDPYCTLECEEGLLPCGGTCADIKNNNDHCGACGNGCGDSGICIEGFCIDCTNKTFCGEDNLCYDLTTDPMNCGGCGQVCPNHVKCQDSQCTGCEDDYVDCDGDTANGCESTTAECECTDNETKSCYYGPAGTENVGACKAGTMTCTAHRWGPCEGMVVPRNHYQCKDQIEDPTQNDLNCDGKVDGTEDYDKDGVSICEGDCCDISGQNSACTNIKNPEVILPGNFEIPNDKIDNNCNGQVDEVPQNCTANYTHGTDLTSDAARNDAGIQLARAMDICDDASTAGYGLVSATVNSLTQGVPGSPALGNAINVFPELGNPPIIKPKLGNSFAGISSGNFQNASLSERYSFADTGTIPPKYHSAHGNLLQSIAGCPTANNINDALALTIELKAPQNATGFQFDFRFFSHEYPVYICSRYNDFFIVLLTSTASGIPADTNIVFDKNGNPVSVNNAFFTTCNPMSCFSSFDCMTAIYTQGCINNSCQTVYGACPDGNNDLAAFIGVTNTGGATAWLTTKAPIVGGETFTLDFIIWDTGDHSLDSAAIIDNFRWIINGSAVQVETDFTDPRT